MKRALFLAMAGACFGCTSVASIDASVNTSVARTMMNQQKRSCMVSGAQCGQLGIYFLHADALSKGRYLATESIDREGAQQAFRRGCQYGDATSCRALVEFELVASPKEREWATRRAAFFGKAVRTKAEVQAEQDKAQAEATKADNEHRQQIAKAQAEIDAQTPSFWEVAGQAADATWRSYRYQEEVRAATNAATDTHLDAQTRIDSTLHHANEASRILTDKPLVGEHGTLVDICTPCTEEAKQVGGACKGGASDACISATQKLSTCMEKAQCAKH